MIKKFFAVLSNAEHPSSNRREVMNVETDNACDCRSETMLERAIRLYEVPVKRLCYLYLHDAQLAEDATQETFLKYYRHLADYRGDASDKTYLTRIAINTCKDMLRGPWLKRVDRRVTPDMLPAQVSQTDPAHKQIAVAVMNLPRRLRETVILYYYQQLSTREVADILGISQPAVSGRLKRARKLLRDTVKEGEIDE